jgi:SpoVK/Ycf46/Vps4 family AAA+-type ATPase
MLQAPSGAGKSVLVQQVAHELRANLLVLDSSLLSMSQLRIEDFFAAAVRTQPSLLVIDDLELLFPRVLDEVKYKTICKLVRCLEEISTSPLSACVARCISNRIVHPLTLADAQQMMPHPRESLW